MRTVFATCLFLIVCINCSASQEKLDVTLAGDYEYTPKRVKRLDGGSSIDARTASFLVSNSRNQNPTIDRDCNVGELATNNYPLIIDGSPNVTLVGGRFRGQVPQLSDWRSTYCNSSAILVRDSPAATIKGVRIDQVWDAIRFASASKGFTLAGSWISRARDDCVENDYLVAGGIQDTLFDGCFYGISIDPGRTKDRSGVGEEFTLDRVLMRMTPYSYKGQLVHGMPFKTHPLSPRLSIRDSIFAFESANVIGEGRLSRAWEILNKCSNNLLLWFPETPIPSAIAKPPEHCFRVLTGRQAKIMWEKERENWIACHPEVPRLEIDSDKTVTQCSGPAAARP